VLAEIDAGRLPEILVVNKVDAADEVSLTRLRHLMPTAVFVSARTGQGIDRLREVIAAALPDPSVTVEVLVPFNRGDLVSRVHAEGTGLDEEHVADGTRLRARANPGLSGLLAGFAVPVITG
jgi:GTP-binding protein HflX